MRWMLIVGMAAATLVAKAKSPTVADFMGDAKIQKGSVQLSPTGDFLSMVVPRDNRSDLLILDRVTRKPVGGLTMHPGEHVNDHWWVSDRRVVAGLSKKFPGRQKPYSTGELIGVDADGKDNLYLFGYRKVDRKDHPFRDNRKLKDAFATVLEPRASKDDTILIGLREFSLGEIPYLQPARLNVKTGVVKVDGKRLPLRYLSDWLVDQQGLLRWVWGVDDANFSVLYRRASSGDWELVNHSATSNQTIEPVAYHQDGIRLYAHQSKDGAPADFVLFDPTKGKPEVLIEAKEMDLGDAFLSANRRTAYAVSKRELRGSMVFLDRAAPETQLIKSVMSQFPGETVSASSFSQDGAFAVLQVHSDTNPGTYYLFDRKAGQLALLFRVRPELSPKTLAEMQPVALKARDGLPLHGFLTLPKSGKAPHPMVVLPHGGPIGVADAWGFDPEVQLLASRGFAVLQVNFRGSDGYGYQFIEKAIREWGGKMQDDLTDATQWAIGKGHADAKRVCIMGASYGGYAALMGVAKEPDVYRCAVGMYGVYDLSLMDRKGDIDDTALGRSYLQEFLSDDSNWLKERSPIHQAARIKAKVLLIHGGADQRTPPEHAERMKNALEKAGNTPQWLYEGDEGHGFHNAAKRIEAYEVVLKFLDKHLRAKSPG